MQISKFTKDVLAEMKNVKWPTRRMAIGSTIAVIMISVIVGGYLGAIDLGLKKSYTRLVTSISGEIVSTSTPAIATSTATSTLSNASSTSATATTSKASSTKATTSVKVK